MPYSMPKCWYIWLALLTCVATATVVAEPPVLEEAPIVPPNLGPYPPPPPSESSVLSDEPLEASPTVRRQEISAYPVETAPPIPDGRVQYILGQQVGGGRGLGGNCCGCGCGGECRLGDGCPHPWRTGPGWCDDWCVGPHWYISADGMIMRRENLDIGFLEGLWGVPVDRREQFHYEAGARAYATGYRDKGYGVQLGYIGVDHWQASGFASIPGTGAREFVYTSGFHSGELNFIPEVDSIWRLFFGVRYVQVREEFTTRDVDANALDISQAKNKMIGFQIGARRDLWEYSDWLYVECLANAGLYRNRIKRIDQNGTITDGITTGTKGEDNETSFLGEVSLTGVYRFNDCVAARGGYQILYMTEVTTADRAMIGPGMSVDDLFYHGLHVGLEYRR